MTSTALKCICFILSTVFSIPLLCQPAPPSERLQLDGAHYAVSCTERAETIPPVVLNAKSQGITLDYEDHYYPLNCNYAGFRGYFALSRWSSAQDKGDGGVDVTGAPNSVLVEGANSASITLVPGSEASFGIVLPAEGFIAFDWSYIGGSPFYNKHFTIYINGRSVDALAASTQANGFSSPALQAGDELRLEASAGEQGFTILLKNFRFFSNAMGVIARQWKAYGDDGQQEGHFQQYIAVEKPDFTQILFPTDLSGIESSINTAYESTAPEATGYPVLDQDGLLETTYDQLTLNQETCSFQSSWKDEMLFEDGFCIIYRHWTVRDLCGGNAHKATQVIKVKGACPTEGLDVSPPQQADQIPADWPDGRLLEEEVITDKGGGHYPYGYPDAPLSGLSRNGLAP